MRGEHVNDCFKSYEAAQKAVDDAINRQVKADAADLRIRVVTDDLRILTVKGLHANNGRLLFIEGALTKHPERVYPCTEETKALVAEYRKLWQRVQEIREILHDLAISGRYGYGRLEGAAYANHMQRFLADVKLAKDVADKLTSEPA